MAASINRRYMHPSVIAQCLTKHHVIYHICTCRRDGLVMKSGDLPVGHQTQSFPSSCINQSFHICPPSGYLNVQLMRDPILISVGYRTKKLISDFIGPHLKSPI